MLDAAFKLLEIEELAPLLQPSDLRRLALLRRVRVTVRVLVYNVILANLLAFDLLQGL